MDNDKVLVISTWGLPTQWNKYLYTVDIKHKVFEHSTQSKGLPKNFKCGSRCTTLALASYLRKAFDVDILVFGVDTVVNPSVASSIRDDAEKLYTKWLQDLVNIDNCSCCTDIDWRKVVEISILPGIGHYHGWHFEASIDNIFTKAFYKIYNKLSSTDYSWVFLDLTHGLNYIMVTVLYATVANIIIFNKEGRFVIVNSEPATGIIKHSSLSQQIQQNITQMPQQQRELTDVDICRSLSEQKVQSIATSTTSTLTILDVSRLQDVVSFIRSIAALKYLQPFPLGNVLKEIKEYNPGVGNYLEEHILPFFKSLSNVIVGPTFNNSYVAKGKDEERSSPTTLCLNKEVIFRDIGREYYEFTPKMNWDSKTVEYEHTNIFNTLLVASKKIVDDVCRELTKDGGDKYLLKYLDNVAKYYKRKVGYVSYRLIVDMAKQELSKVLGIVIKNLDYFSQCGLTPKVNGLEVAIKGVLYTAIARFEGGYEQLEKLLNNTYRERSEIGEQNKCRILKEILGIDKMRKWLEEEYKKVNSNSGRDKLLRNLCAHAGFGYTIIEEIIINVERRDITKVLYNEKLLYELLKHAEILYT